ncbi:MAG: hypothetical protein Q9218_002229 [Villophora microphyllina]
MTSHAPPSSILTVPTTQNTAPVLSFNCLYTHDLRRKAKRWQDGILRFHTFNKRVMVYDVPRNFIGDTHWREPQAIQDGDELELEKGVLIQVGEEVERTETDLTGLLEKRKVKPTPGGKEPNAQDELPRAHLTPRNQPTSAVQSAVARGTSTPLSQLRPKSLNALLGTPKGPVGRASLPTKSPADQRREKENSDIIEGGHSPKRRRLESSTDSRPSALSTKTTVQQPLLQSVTGAEPELKTTGNGDFQAKLLANGKPLRRERQESARDRQDIHSHRSSKDASPGNVRLKETSHEFRDTRSSSKNHIHLNCQEQRPNEKNQHHPQPVPKVPSHPLKSKRTEATSNSTTRDRRSPHQVTIRNAEADDLALHDQPRPTNLLRIAKTKPRRKLMYRDLLPQKAPPIDHVQSSKEEPSRSSRPKTLSNRKVERRRENLLDDFHEAQRGRLQDRLSRCNRTSNVASEEPLLREDNQLDEDLGITEKPSTPMVNHDSKLPNSLFLTQSSSSETPLNLHEPPTTAFNSVHEQTVSESIPDADVEFLPSSQSQLASACPDMELSNPKQQPPAAQQDETVNTSSLRNNVNAHTDLVPSTTTQLASTGLNPGIFLPQATEEQISTTEQSIPVDKPPSKQHAVIKAALPPPQQRKPRPFQRCVSDVSARAPARPRENGFTKPSALRRNVSADTTNVSTESNIAPRPPLIRTTNLYVSNVKAGGAEKKTPTPREQVADPWSREAFDLFGFDGCNKKVSTDNGMELAGQERRDEREKDSGDGNEGMGYVLDDIMAESQGFV